MKHLACFLEESSAKEMLQVVLPKVLPENVQVHWVVFEGKQDLDKQLVRKLKNWVLPDSCFLVMRDKDSEDCIVLKQRLLEKVKESGKSSVCLVRIACHELESFYLGDLTAVEAAFGMKGLANRQRAAKYRHTDRLSNAAEELKKLTGNRYQKIKGSRAIAPYMSLDHSNCSNSFNVLISGIQRMYPS